MLIPKPTWRVAIPAIVLLAGLLYLLVLPSPSLRLNPLPSTGHRSSHGAKNATLGFGAIFVLTDDVSSWRTQGLKLAAKHLGLEFQIPLQAKVTDDNVSKYLEGDELIASSAYVKATMSYQALLKQFLETGVETALFVEDDVDFSIHIKDQLEMLSRALWEGKRSNVDKVGQHVVRKPRREEGLNLSAALDRQTDPYRKDEWDVFWLGHYGIEFTNTVSTRTYSDPHALPWSRLTSPFNNYYEQQRDKEQSDGPQAQQIMFNATSLATFAWAITRFHAEWLLNDLRSRRAQQFDVAMHVHCKGGKQRCMIPVPELMHHHKAVGEIDIGTQGNGSVARKDLDWWKGVHKYTYNIEWSARCNAAAIGEKLKEAWQCLPGRYDDLI